jgi:putative heme-binding domain-containing protein
MNLLRVVNSRARLGTLLLCVFSFGADSKPDPFLENIRNSPALTGEQQQKTFHLPPGFEIQLVAAEPDIGKPINMAFDASGRLWITESREYPFPAKPDKGRDKIRVLSDFDENGRAKKISVFAEGLNIPIGIYPFKQGVIAFSIPYIYYFRDTDGDGKADQKEILYGRFGFERDTHGLTGSFRRGFDGWLYGNHGYNNISTIQGTDGKAFTMRSGNVYRMRVDGTHAEQFVWGTVNPFGTTFDPLGNIYISDCHTWPIDPLLRGGYYPHFGNTNDGLGYAPTIMHHLHGSTAIAGIACYADEQFPAEYRNNFFIGNPMTCRVDRDSLVQKGSTGIAKEEADFVACDDPWFRPVDVQLGPDGALYVADFYNRIIGHYEVALDHPGRDRERGRIWRIVYTGGGKVPRPASPDLAVAATSELIGYLNHANLGVRMRATDQITDRIGAAAAEPLKAVVAQTTSAIQKVHALWALHRLGTLEAATLAAGARDGDRVVRVHSMRMFADMTTLSAEQHEIVLAALKDADPLVQRCAADALAWHADAANIRPLLDLISHVPAEDEQLVYTIRLSLKHQLLVAGMFAHLPAGMSEQDARIIAGVCLAVPSAEAGSFLIKHLETKRIDPAAADPSLRHAARYAPDAELGVLTSLGKTLAGNNADAGLALFKAVQEGLAQRGKALDESARQWAMEVASQLLANPGNGKRASERRQGAAELARTVGLAKLEPQLTNLLADKSADAASRSAAAKALAGLRAQSLVAGLSKILADGSEPASLREQGAAALAELKTGPARQAIADAMQAASQGVQTKFALALVADREGAELLLQTIAAGKASPRLLLEASVKERLAAAKLGDLDQRIAKLTQGLAPASEAIQKLIDQRRAAFKADAASADKGAKVFATNCAACHSIGGQSGMVGPQLDGVATRGVDRIIEDVLDPNRNVDPGFYYSMVTLADGNLVVGLQRREEGELLVFADTTGKEIKVAKKEIKKRVESKRSLMLDNFHELIGPDDFNDLLAYLMAKGGGKQ